MSDRKSSYEYDSSVYNDYDTRSSNDNDSNMDLLEDDNSDLSELDLSDEEEEDIDETETDDDEYEYAPTIKEQKIQIRERERERKSSTRSTQSLQNSFVIPHEAVIVPMGTKENIDKMLAYRTNPENNAEEILVKYKTMSYLDVEWIHRKQLEDKIGKVRVRKFIEKFLYTQTNWSVDEVFNPNFTKMDRIIDEGELGDKIYYLVKWKSLSYDDCTWEPRELVLDVNIIK